MNEILNNKRSGKDDYLRQKLAKESERDNRKRAERRRFVIGRVLWLGGVAVLVGAMAWGVAAVVRSSKPLGQDFSQAFPIQNSDHIDVGAEHPPYSSNPPSSGWHYAKTARKDFYAEAVPDEYIVHNLEHGDVWIAYNPAVPESVKQELKKFLLPKVIITPREVNERDIALVAWGRVDSFNLTAGSPVPAGAGDDGVLPSERIKDFIRRYRNKGPEKIPAGAHENNFN